MVCYGTQFPAHQVGRSLELWDVRPSGLEGLCIMGYEQYGLWVMSSMGYGFEKYGL